MQTPSYYPALKAQLKVLKEVAYLPNEQDFAVLQFLHEMRSVDLEALHFGFFSHTRHNVERTCYSYASSRMARLLEHGYVKLHTLSHRRHKIYVCTELAIKALSIRAGDTYRFTQPHEDQLQREIKLAKIRLCLEKTQAVLAWQCRSVASVRMIFSGTLYSFHLPDASCQSPNGDTLAIELVTHEEGLQRCLDMMHGYRRELDSQSNTLYRFKQVQIFCEGQPELNLLREKTNPYSSIFQIEKLSKLFKKAQYKEFKKRPSEEEKLDD